MTRDGARPWLHSDIPEADQPRVLFWSKTRRAASGCREWRGLTLTTRNPYGTVWFRGRLWLAHRLAWTLKRGAIPPGRFVCHRCDNCRCVEVGHLFLGGARENGRDYAAKRDTARELVPALLVLANACRRGPRSKESPAAACARLARLAGAALAIHEKARGVAMSTTAESFA